MIKVTDFKGLTFDRIELETATYVSDFNNATNATGAAHGTNVTCVSGLSDEEKINPEVICLLG